jgi:hypothetical protein
VSGALSNSLTLLQKVIESFFLKASNFVLRELGFQGVLGISGGITAARTFVVSPVAVIPVFVTTITTVPISAPIPLPVSLALPIPQLLLPFLFLLSLKLPSFSLSSPPLLLSLKPLLFLLPLSSF